MKLEKAPPTAGALLSELHGSSFDRPWSEQEFTGFLGLSTHEAWILTDKGGDPVGFVLLIVLAPELEIATLCILPAHRGQGLGRELLKQSLQRYRNFEVCFLEVAETNDSAIALYTSQGFVGSGRRDKYYKQEDGTEIDAILMSKNLR